MDHTLLQTARDLETAVKSFGDDDPLVDPQARRIMDRVKRVLENTHTQAEIKLKETMETMVKMFEEGDWTTIELDELRDAIERMEEQARG